MSNHLQLGAIDIDKNRYVTPSNGIKGNSYKCIECDKKVILKKGKIRIPHFAHYAQTNTCHYYDHPNEAQIHKDAKMLMAQLLKDKKKILFTWECKLCGGYYAFDNDDSTIIYKDGDEVFTEYRSKDNKWVADVAIINNNEIRYIIEIKNTHTTITNRPEPWFEIDAKKLIEEVNENNEDMNKENEEQRKTNVNHIDWIFPYRVPCIRNIDRYCYGSFCYKEQWVRRIPGYNKTLEDNSCILCHKEEYEPGDDGCTGKFQGGNIRVCYDCLFKESYEKKLRVIYETSDSSVYSSLKEYSLRVLNMIPTLMIRIGMNGGWKQEISCTSCDKSSYSPVYENNKYYAMCKICFDNIKSLADNIPSVKPLNFKVIQSKLW